MNETWPIVKKGWSLTSRRKLELADKTLKQYREGQFNDPPELQYVLFDFSSRLLMPKKYHLFEDAADHCKHIAKSYMGEFQSFRSYFKSQLSARNLDRYLETFKEYFNCFSDFSQTLMHVQYGIELPDDFEASSYAFSKTKLFCFMAMHLKRSQATLQYWHA